MDIKTSYILRSNFVYTENKDEFIVKKDKYLIVIDGIVDGFYDEVPKEYLNLKVYDYKNKIVIPGMIDLHMHASQYGIAGIKMDLPLIDWLKTYTFKEESQYKDREFSIKRYSKFVKDLKKSPTTRAVIFGTIHNESTEILMDLLDQNSISAYVGKVNMDMPNDNLYYESTDESLKGTMEFINAVKGKYKHVKPIIAPRFAVSCTGELLEKLGEVAKDKNLPVQSHLNENKEEIQTVKQMFKDIENYAKVYDKYNLFGNEVKTIMAHCVYCGEDELDLLKSNGVYVAHCAQSNTNLASGIAPVKKMLDKGIKIGIGTDVAGGASLSMFRAVTDAIQVSKLYKAVVDNSTPSITFENAFHMATKIGGEFFGSVGSFEKGYEFDALILDDNSINGDRDYSLTERLERIFYISNHYEVITDKFIAGNKVI